MPAKRLSMRKLREIFRLHFDNKLTSREIGTSCLTPPSTVHQHGQRDEGGRRALTLAEFGDHGGASIDR